MLTFIKDGFRISKAHNEDYGGKYFSGLDSDTQRYVLKYEFVVDLLQDMPDNEVYDLFARINTYSEKLKPQELRNARWFGEFKSSVYLLSKEFVNFLGNNKVFSPKQILRMAEAEFISDLLLAIHEGIREGKKTVLDNCYKSYDDRFVNRRRHEKQFRETMDTIGGIVGSDLPNLKFRATRLFYPLFCATYHLKFGLPRLHATRAPIKPTDYPRLKMVLESVETLLYKIETAEKGHEELALSADERKFYDAYSEHWVHADKRTILTQYLCRHFVKTMKS